MLVRILLVAFFSLAVAHPAAAKWRVAESDNFVIYAEDSEKDLRRFATMLESYHAAIGFVTGRQVDKPSPSNRVTIFVAGSQRDVKRLYNGNSKYVAGFYVPRASGSYAFVQDIKITSGEPTFSMIVLLHEYAHHYMIASSRYGLPRWISEGGAEFFASAKFPRDGRVMIGRPANHRAGELYYADEVSVRELLDPELYEANKGKGYDAYYGKAWLLYHYLTFNEARSGQMAAYMRAMMEGQDSMKAAEQVFGDIDTLEKEVDRYLEARRMTAYSIKPELLTIGNVEVRDLSEGADKAMDVVMVSKSGVDEKEAQDVLKDARKIAAAYPDDPFVLAALAEAEYDAGNDEAAIAAADRAIAADPETKNAYVQKGYALFRRAEDADDRDAAYKAAMAPFSALNAIENDHPLPLIYYYRSFAERGEEPPEQARHALERAAQLAPFDKSLWMNVGMMQAQEGKIALAKLSLEPLANDPHGGRTAGAARMLIRALGRATEGEPFRAASAFGAIQPVDIDEHDGADESE